MPRLPVLLAALLLAALAAAPARAADSLAPPGAPISWLPTERWVLDHWLPYDETQLFAALGMQRNEIRRYFQHPVDNRVPPLADVVRQRGMSVRGLAVRLVRAWHPKGSRAHRRALYDHAERTLTQGHLLQHMFFHPLHSQTLRRSTQALFGIAPADLARRLRAGQSRSQIARTQGRSDAQVTQAATAVLRRVQSLAVRRQWTPRSEARRELAMQTGELPAWLSFAAHHGQHSQAMMGR